MLRGVLLHQLVDGIAVAGELALVAVAEAAGALDYLLGPIALDDHALDRVGGSDRSNASVFGKLGQKLRQLVFVEALTTLRGIDPGKDGTQCTWLRGEGPVNVYEALNGANNRTIELKRGLFSSIM